MTKTITTDVERAAHHLGLALERRLPNLGVNQAEAHVLAHLAETGPVPAGDLRESVSMTPSGITAVLDRLERRGFVRRSANPDDRRSILVALAKDGTWAAAEVTAMLEAIERRVRRRVSAEDLKGFERVLAAIETEVGR